MLSEPLVAEAADMWLLLSMGSQVASQVALLSEPLVAEAADMRLRSRVNPRTSRRRSRGGHIS